MFYNKYKGDNKSYRLVGHVVSNTECKKLCPELINTIGLGSFDCSFHIEMISNVETVVIENGKLELVCSSNTD